MAGCSLAWIKATVEKQAWLIRSERPHDEHIERFVLAQRNERDVATSYNAI
jgi:hypothetical protein